MNVLQKWMAKATPTEKTRLARLAGISRAVLQWTAGSYRTKGKINVAPDIARKIEIASVKLVRDGLPPLKRETLSATCARCEYAKRAK